MINSPEGDRMNKLFYFDKNQENEIVSTQDDYSFTPFILTTSNQVIIPEPLSKEEDVQIYPELNINNCFIDPLEQSFFESLFKEASPKKVSLFSILEKDSFTEKKIFNQRKRYPVRRRRKENNDNIRKKIKRAFLNSGLIKKINMIIKNKGGRLFFRKFQMHFVNDVSKKTNKKLLNMTLKEIFTKKELYQNKELTCYYHNLKVIESQEIQEDEDLKNILNQKYFKIFEEYINSNEFLIDIERLKNNNDDLYIKRYINHARHFIDFILE